MQVKLKINKSLEENASEYYNKAKKSRSKIEPITEIIEKYKKEMEKVLEKQDIELQKQEKIKTKRKTYWYEKFRWFFSSEGFLVIGGRDATSNEILIKKHLDKEDIVFHTDMAGSPFFVVKKKQEFKGESKKIEEKTLQEAASATACYSRAWKLGLATLDVFYVKPEQVTKETKAGEYMQKGSFMIMGKTSYVKPQMEISISVKKEEDCEIVIGGPTSAIQSQSENFIRIIQGSEKPSDTAKKIRKKIGGDLDEIIRMLPPGGCKIEKINICVF